MHFGGNRQPVHDFIQAVKSNFCSIFNRVRDIAGFAVSESESIFPYPTVPAKIGVVPFGIDP